MKMLKKPITRSLKQISFLLVYIYISSIAFAEEIKTVDGAIIEGEIVSVDEEYLVIRQSHNHILFVQWRIISCIIRKDEIFIVSCNGDKKKFLILSAPGNTVSAKDMKITETDSLSALYPEKILAQYSFLPSESAPDSGLAKDISATHSDVQLEIGAQTVKQWKGNVDGGLTLQTGNNDTMTTSIKANFSQERMNDNFYFNSLLLYETNGGAKNADEQRGTFKYELKHWQKWYSFYQESVEHDEVEKLNLRSITSAGIGYRFFETDRLKYKSEIGPSFTYERFRDNILQTSAGLRIGNYLDWQIFPSTLFYSKVDYLPVPEDFADWRLESDTGLRQTLTKSLSFNLSWINEYDNQPSAENVKRNDATILSTIGYNF